MVAIMNHAALYAALPLILQLLAGINALPTATGTDVAVLETRSFADNLALAPEADIVRRQGKGGRGGGAG